MQFLRNIYFKSRFFFFLMGIAFIFILSFFFKGLFVWAQRTMFLFIAVSVWDLLFLFTKVKPLTIERIYPDKLSNGDYNDFQIVLKSHYPWLVNIRVLEELPIQFQERGFEYERALKVCIPEEIHYQLRPVTRGVYSFGNCVVLIQHLGVFERRVILKERRDLPCYPSFIQLRKYLLMVSMNRLSEIGVKRIRRVGATLEFEQVKEYSRGDEYRFINWKATGKTKKLMVNQYEDERSQPIYSFIDLSRTMRMPFDGLTLLDYAINSSLVLSNVTILKQDRAGLLTFSKKVEKHIAPEKRNHQMYLISEALYNVQTNFSEAEFGNLYVYTKRNINQRALIFLYTNFESIDALNRQLPYLKLMNKSHSVVVILFKNTELESLAKQKANKTIEIYNQIISEKFLYEKQLIVQELQSHGIQTIFTEPSLLTINSINKYLEIKARGVL